MHIIFYCAFVFAILEILSNSRTLGESWGFPGFHIWFLSNNETRIFDFNIFSSNISFISEKSYDLLSYILIGYIFGGKIIKQMILVSIFDKNFKYKNGEIPNSLRGSLSFLEFLGSQNKNLIKYDMHEWPMYNIPNWNFGLLQTYPLKMYLALEIRVG